MSDKNCQTTHTRTQAWPIDRHAPVRRGRKGRRGGLCEVARLPRLIALGPHELGAAARA
jgi:hypothetical protein